MNFRTKIDNKYDPKRFSLSRPAQFPSLWVTLLDEVIPQFVKERYSPQESWKKKPFSQTDVVFFSKGLLDLSDFFTLDRESATLPNYFTTAKFRSSYFLYFFALQGAKFLTLFDRYPLAVEAALAHAKKTGVLSIVDVGSGPGTASIAFLIHVLDRYKSATEIPFQIHLHWIDHNQTIMKDGELFLQRLLERFPQFDGDISLTTEFRSWWKHPRDYDFTASIVLFGNVLNESSKDPKVFLQGLAPFLKDPQGAGVLMVEPAFRSASQRLSQIRDELMPRPLWGPCLHVSKCPLAEGRDWCHFSVPVKLPGSFFKRFSIKLGGVRDWLKFSFIWLAANEDKKEAVFRDLLPLVRIVSDPMTTPRGQQNQICRPDRVGWVPSHKNLFRGEVIRYDQKRYDSVLQSDHPKTRDGKSVRKPIRRPGVRK